MAAPVLKPSYEWCGTENFETITAIYIVDSYDVSKIPSGVSVVGSWAADVNDAGEAMSYEFSDGVVVLSGNGSGKIVANAYCAFMFSDWSALTRIEGLELLDVSQVTDMSSMFKNCEALNEMDLSNFDTSCVGTMNSMFHGCKGMQEIDVTSFDTSLVTDMRLMFRTCTALTTIYASQKWSTESVESSGAMFTGSSKLVGGNGTAYNSSVIDATYARIDTADAPGYFTYKMDSDIDMIIKSGILSKLADAIREKNGSTDTYTPAQMVEAILALNIGSSMVTITASNIGEHFDVTNGSYYFAGVDDVFTTNNGGVHNSTAQTTLTAKYDMKVYVTYSYASEATYDKFTFSAGSTTVENAVSGAATTRGYIENITAGTVLAFTYTKDKSNSSNGDKCTFSIDCIAIA